MPNWCNNFVEVSHEDPAKIKALAEAFERGEFCDHVIPVPQELKETVSGFLGDPEKQADPDRQDDQGAIRDTIQQPGRRGLGL